MNNLYEHEETLATPAAGNACELNYREAYLYLFNRISDLSNHLLELQTFAEELCIAEADEPRERPRLLWHAPADGVRP